MPARVMVFAKINRGDEEAFEAAYAEVTSKVKGTHGTYRRRAPAPGGSAGCRGRAAHLHPAERVGKQGGVPRPGRTTPIHMQTTTPMRPYWAGKVERIIFDVAHTIKSSS